MLIIDNIKRFLAERSINKVLSNQNRQTYYPDFKSIKSVLLLFKSDEDEKNDFIRSIINDLKKQGKSVTVWGYLDKKEIENPILPDFRLFCNADTTFYSIPKPLLTNEFTHAEYDMVISMCKDDIYTLDYLLAKANSPFKVSKVKPHKGIADFMIQVDEDAAHDFFYKQIMHYMNSIQSKS